MSVVDHPPHYNAHPSGIECIDVVETLGFNLGNAVKYIWRAGIKYANTAEQDFRKAHWYLTRVASTGVDPEAADATEAQLRFLDWCDGNPEASEADRIIERLIGPMDGCADWEETLADVTDAVRCLFVELNQNRN